MRINIIEQEINEELDLYIDRVNKESEFFDNAPGIKLIDVNVYCKPKKLSLYYAVIKFRIIEENN